MSHKGPKSLRTALTKSIILMQSLVLLFFMMVVAMPIMQLIKSGETLDDRIIPAITNAVVRDTAGALELVPNDQLEGLIESAPDIWFLVSDSEGATTRYGAVPEQLTEVADAIPHITFANIADTTLPGTAAIVRQGDGPAGRLWVVTGGGPRFAPTKLLGLVFNPFFFGLLALFAIASVLVVPLVIRRQLRGLEAVAAEADMIDAGQRGMRLSSSAIPRELHPLVAAVNDALSRLDRASERQHRFMADAAHELRTPIAILKTRIELLPESPDRLQLQLDVSRLEALANQLLDLQRMELTDQPLRPIDLVEVASQVTADLAPLAIATGDELVFHAEVRSLQVLGDYGALSRALTNLVQNAISHGGKGIEITVSVLRDGRLRVADNGPGIPTSQLEMIFEPFHRVVPSQRGAGLGLNLVQDIVQKHHGRISVTNGATGGAQFEIALPLAAA